MKEITKIDLTSVSITEHGIEVDGYINEIKDKSIQSFGIPQNVLKEKVIVCQEDDGEI